MKFILTHNLNKLAVNLRFLGYDCFVAKSLSIHNISRLVNKQNAVFLTKNKKDIRIIKKGILISSDFLEKQLIQIKHLLRFDENLIFTRCSICNKVLQVANKPLLDENIIKKHKHIAFCPMCGRYYYKGSHYKQIYQKLKNIFL